MRWSARLLAVALLVLLGGCDEPSERPASSGGRGPFGGRGPTGGRAVPEAPSSPPPSPARGRSARAAQPSSTVFPRPTGEAPAAPPPSDEADAPAPRTADPAPEALRRAFGTPTQCISAATRSALGDSITIHVQASVMGSGRVTRASVSGTGLSSTDRECLRRHAESLSLGMNVPDAPRTVTTSVEYAVRATPGEEREVEPSVARIPGQVAPDRTLPAIAESPPSGQVAPGVTLPASGTVDQRPRGFVPPSSTLPAQGPVRK